MKVAAIEFKDEESAAAKIAATTNPLKPVGIDFVMKSGKTLSPPANGNVAGTPGICHACHDVFSRIERRVKGEQQNADKKKSDELSENDRAAR
jgi:hypothetical protein